MAETLSLLNTEKRVLTINDFEDTDKDVHFVIFKPRRRFLRDSLASFSTGTYNFSNNYTVLTNRRFQV